MEEWSFAIWLICGLVSLMFSTYYITKLASERQKKRHAEVMDELRDKTRTLSYHMGMGYWRKWSKIHIVLDDMLQILPHYFFVFKWANPVGKLDTMQFLAAGGYLAGIDYKFILMWVSDVIGKVLERF